MVVIRSYNFSFNEAVILTNILRNGINIGTSKLLNSEQNAQVCDATKLIVVQKLAT